MASFLAGISSVLGMTFLAGVSSYSFISLSLTLVGCCLVDRARQAGLLPLLPVLCSISARFWIFWALSRVSIFCQLVTREQGFQWLDQTAVKTVGAPDQTARSGALKTDRYRLRIFNITGSDFSVLLSLNWQQHTKQCLTHVKKWWELESKSCIMDLVADSDAEKWHQPKHMRSEIFYLFADIFSF